MRQYPVRTCSGCPSPISRGSKTGHCVYCANRARAVPGRRKTGFCVDCSAPITIISTRCRTCDAGTRRIGPLPVPAEMHNAEVASDMLCERIEALYRQTAKQRRCSVEAAMKLLNYSPAVLAKMAA